MQCACAILSSLACPALQYFPTLTHKRHHLKKKLLNTKCVFWFSLQLLSETFLMLRRNERDMIKNVYRSASCKVPFIIVRLQWNLNFLKKFSKNPQISNFHENPSSGSRVVPYGRRAMTKLIVAYRNFANAPKTELVQPFKVYTCQLFLLHVNNCKKHGVTLQNNSTCIYCTNELTNHLHGAQSFLRSC
jgi:hypothetical protein